MGPIAVIDLGELPAGQVSDEPAARPWPHARRALGAVAVGLALVTVGGDAPASRPLPMAVLDLPAAATAYAVSDRLFVANVLPTGVPGGDRFAAAYRLMDLSPLWRIALPVNGDVAALTVAGDTLVLTAVQPDVQVGMEPAETVGLDAATGRVRWRTEGFVQGSTADGRLLLSIQAQDPGDESPTLRALAADTGDVVWSYRPPPGAMLVNPYDGLGRTVLGVLLPGGRVELRDIDTGQILRSGQVDVTAGVIGADRYAEIVGDLLMVRDGLRVTAYGLDRLDRRWTVRFEPGQDGSVLWCGDLLCLRGGNSPGISMLEPNTGRVKWSDPRWSSVLPAGEHMMAMESDPQRDGQRVAVIDPETGHERRDLGEWQALDWNPAGGPLIGLRYGFTQVLVARLDPEAGARVLTVLRDVGRDCRVNAPMLLCRRTDGRLGVWRLPV